MKKALVRTGIILAAVLLFLFFWMSGVDRLEGRYSGAKPDVEDWKSLAAAIWEYAQSHPEGFTVNVRDLSSPSEGIAVSYKETQGSTAEEDLPAVVLHALSHDGYIGGWLDPETGEYLFDSVRLFPEDSLKQAVLFGRENGQRFIYVISTGEDVRLE